MKPVIHTIIDKNGGESTQFNPTSRMILYSIFKSENPGLPDREVCAMAGLDPQLPSRWAIKYGTIFLEWVEEAVDQGSQDDAKVLERVGMMQAVQAGNYQYWRDMARTKGVIKDEQPKKGITLNTDFTVILASVGGDLNAARQQLLSAARGLGHERLPGLVGPIGSGNPSEHSGAGGGTITVQARPVALANSLGANGGRAKQRVPVPAVPEQNTFTVLDETLDDGAVPAGAKVSPDDSDMAF